MTDLSPLSRLSNLQINALEENYISDFSPVSQVYIEYGKKQQKHLSLFYKKLIEESTGIIDLLKKLDELSGLIEDVHQMKFFYSFVIYSYRTGSIDLEQRNGFIQNGLSMSAKFTSNENQWTIFRLILDKSCEDGVSSKEQEIRFDRRGELNNTKNVFFIKDLQEAVIANTTAIKGIQALQKNINTNSLKSSLQRKMAIESGVNFMGSVLNAVSIGFAGSALQAFCAFSMSDIVDFSEFLIC
ncbi:MAG: hypothetical protein AB8G05_08020 [Oligoflexales bacterium]